MACSKEIFVATTLKYSLKEPLNKMVFKLNLHELAHKSYGLFYNGMQNYMKSLPIP